MEPRGASDVAVVDAPKDLQPRVDALHACSAIVEPLELFCGPGNRRKTPEVDLLLHADRKPVVFPGIADLRHGAGQPTVLGRAAVFQRAPRRLVANIGHGPADHRLAHAVVAV